MTSEMPTQAALLAALRRGKRFPALLQGIEPSELEGMLKGAGQPIRHNASNRERLVRQKAQQLLLPRLRQQDVLANHIVRRWCASRSDQLVRHVLEGIPELTWRTGLLVRFYFGWGEPTLPEAMASRVDEFIGGGLPVLRDTEFDAIRRTVLALDVLRRIETVDRGLGAGVAGARDTLAGDPWTEDLSARETVARCLGIRDWISAMIRALEPELAPLSTLGRHLGLAVCDDSVDAWFATLVHSEDRMKLTEALAAVRDEALDCFEASYGLIEVERLVAGLLPRAPDVDRVRITAEWKSLRERVEAEPRADVRALNPVMGCLLDLALGHRSFDEVASVLGPLLTWSLMTDLRDNGLRFEPTDEIETVTLESDTDDHEGTGELREDEDAVEDERVEVAAEVAVEVAVENGEAVEARDVTGQGGFISSTGEAVEDVMASFDLHEDTAVMPADASGAEAIARVTERGGAATRPADLSVTDEDVERTETGAERVADPTLDPRDGDQTWPRGSEADGAARVEPEPEHGPGRRRVGSMPVQESKAPLLEESDADVEFGEDESISPSSRGAMVDGRPEPSVDADGDGADERAEAVTVSPAELTHMSEAAFAERLLDAGLPYARDNLRALTARLIFEERLEEAYWLSRTFAAEERSLFQLIDALQLGVNLQPGFRRAEVRLGQLFKDELPLHGDFDRDAALILCAALIRPALMASASTEPNFLLDQIPQALSFLPQMHRFIEVLTDFSHRRQTMSPTLFAGLRMLAEWEERKARLEQETERWLEESPNRKVKYDAATRVWTYWVRPTGQDGDLRRLVFDARSGCDDDAGFEARIADWSEEGAFTRRLDQADLAVNRRARRKPIKYGARDALKRMVDVALDLARQWCDLHASNPRVDGGRDLIGRETLIELAGPAADLAEQLADYESDSHPPLFRAAAHWCRVLMREVADQFTSDITRRVAEDPFSTRRQWLLRVPRLGDEPTFETMDDGARVEALLRVIAEPLGLDQALHAQLEVGHLDAAQALLGLIEREQGPRGDLAEAIQSARRRWIDKALDAIAGCLDELEGRHLKGALTLDERDALSTDAEGLHRRLEAGDEGPLSVLEKLQALRGKIDACVERRRDEILGQRAQLLDELSHRGRPMPADIDTLIEQALEQGDFSVVADLIARCRTGAAIDPAAYRTMPAWFEDFAEALPTVHPLALDPQRSRRELARATGGEGFFAGLDEAVREPADAALAAWQRLSHPPRLSKSLAGRATHLVTLLRWLGYHDVDEQSLVLVEQQIGQPVWLHFQVEARMVSPLPRFGSRAGGRHDVLVVWGKASAEQIAQRLSGSQSLERDRAITLLVTSPLDAMERRRLVHAIRRQRHCPLVIDACLVTWLCLHDAEARSEALFAVGLAGGYENPYTPTGGGVPPEIFVGRQQDIERLWDRSGTCIVYGGRQLGKSALLRQVIRLYHKPEAEHFVLYDGTKNDTQVWEVVRRLLTQNNLLKSGTTNPQSIKHAVLDLLERNPRRRIVLLLDECDGLLDNDMKAGFVGVALLRDLMTETDRRFKVVFAGLHNVQRFQRIPNQPLAHFGEPLCVGPLEPRAALELVERPLAVLGYRFERPTLPQRILAHTNCHPSLLQLFCFSLVGELLRARPQPVRTPPFLIRERDITAVYRSVDLGRNMRLRFDWTLNLDDRYRAIGYVFAYLEVTDFFTEGHRDGLLAGSALEQVSVWWPQGFDQTDQDELEGLLDEMVGLGVLAKHGHRFRLRSPNILRLLGGPDEIAGELERFETTEPRRIPDPHVIHRTLGGDGVLSATSPLTLAQESRLLNRSHGVDLIIGSKATGLFDVRSALEHLYGQRAHDETLNRPIVELDGGQPAEEIVAQARAQYHQHTAATALTVYIDSARTLVEGGELEALVEFVDKLRTTKRFIRVVVPLEPSDLYVLRREHRLEAIEGRERVSVYRLRRWRSAGLERFFDDVERSPPDRLDSLLERTGGWPCVVRAALDAMQHMGPADGWPDIDVPSTLSALSGLADIEQGQRLLAILTEWRPDRMALETLQQFADGTPAEVVETFARCALDLCIVDGTLEGLLAEPALGRVVQGA